MITATRHVTEHEQGMLKRALKHQDGLTLPMVLGSIEDGSYVVLRGDKTVVTLSQTEDAIHVNQYAGSLLDLDQLAPAIIKIAKDFNKRYIDMNGRKGWTKVLKEYGMYPINQDKFTHYRRDSYGWR